MADIDDIIAGAKLPESTVVLCLRGDLQAAFEDLERRLAEARDNDEHAGSLAAGGEARKFAVQIEELRAEMRAHERVFHFRGLSRRAYSDLMAEHPAHEGHKGDTDVCWETFPAALISKCCLAPAMSTGQAERLCDVISQRQWDDLWVGAYSVCRGEIGTPKSFAASAILASSAPKSKPPEPGVSPAEGSSAGSPAG